MPGGGGAKTNQNLLSREFGYTGCCESANFYLFKLVEFYIIKP